MKLLLDTQVVLWAFFDLPFLEERQRALIAHRDNQCWVSMASPWEIEIKRGLGRLDAPENLDTVVRDFGWHWLQIELPHTRMVGQLPLLHRDPFDRMLVAQATVEGMALMTADRRLAAYGVPVLW
ncbi:MAG: hypothetical protein RLY86_1175 [Pseudomonadota bacterium]|jgi:PIN domain nuclease of toxin-antitoxin system